MPTIGVVVVSAPGMKHVTECLKSIAWADEALLLYGGEAPPTSGAESFPALRACGFAAPAEAIRHVDGLRSDWVFYLWGDERVEGALADELRSLCRDAEGARRSWPILVRSYILGAWVNGGIAGATRALLRREDRKNLFAPPPSRGEGRAARGWIADYGTGELNAAVERVQAVSDFWAESCAAAAFAAPPAVFFRTLCRNRFFSGGLPAVTLAALASYTLLMAGAKAWQAAHVKNENG